jgi:hypothetical protein
MNQAVITFTNSTARASAITSPVEGMITYLADTDTYQFWNGSAWTNLVSSTVGTGNAIINGAFEINQRNFTSLTTNGSFGFDRWKLTSGSGSGTSTYTPQSFTPGSAPVAGQEAARFAQVISAGQAGANDWSGLGQVVEGVRTFAGQTVTLSFWAKATSGTPNVGVTFEQNFGVGGSSLVYIAASLVSISTSWARYSVTVAIPSISGKTLGTAGTDGLGVYILNSTGSTLTSLGFANTGLQNGTFQYWGVQLEAGSTATAFRRNANSLQGELAACQRYYLQVATGNNLPLGTGANTSTTLGYVVITHPVEMRATPTLIQTTGANYYTVNATAYTQFTGIDGVTTRMTEIYATGSGLTLGRAGIGRTTNSLASIALSSEL